MGLRVPRRSLAIDRQGWSVRATAAFSMGVAIAATTAPREVHACKCGAPRTAAVVEPHVVAGDASQPALDLELVEGVLDCGSAQAAPTLDCEWRASYTAHWRESEQLVSSAELQLSVGQSTAVSVMVDGTPAEVGPVQQDDGPNAWMRTEVARPTGGTTTTVSVEAELKIDTDVCDCSGPGIDWRHPVVPHPESFRAGFAYRVFSNGIPGVTGRSKAKLVILHPSSVVVESTVSPVVTSSDRKRVHSSTLEVEAPRPGSPGTPTETRAVLSRERKAARGGPLAAVGLGLDPDPAFRLRVGWEAAAPIWLAHSLAFESDARTRLDVVYDLQLISPKGILLSILPSAGIGAGVPLQVFPRARVGVRGATSLAWGPVHIYGSIDHFPGSAGEPALTRGGIMLGGSL